MKLKNLEAELEREIVTSEDWRLECEASDERNKELTLENDKKSESIKQLNNTIVSLKSRLFEANRNLSEYQEKTESDFESEKKKLEKNMKKMKDEYNISLKDVEDEMDLLKDKLERKRQSGKRKLNFLLK